ncbi:MAG: ABC transporter ATP-binding protein [Lachnospiraceae bacterium]|nr:ABC transporter ATP-binding protein [Lachnospiraceae bacterium]
MENEKLLDIKDLSLIYTSEGSVVHAVNKISFSLEKEKTLGLVGETGAGKTSIAKAILSILPSHSSRVTGGEILFEGKDILKLSEKELREIRGNKISMIFQDPMTALNPVKKVGDQIAEGLKLHNDISKKESLEQAGEMLETVGISKDRMYEYPHQFSGGMKQRVIIAMALSCNPTLLLADEPTTALDVTIQAQVLRMMNDLHEKYRTATILITHDLGVVAEMCDEVGVVYAGEIVEYGSKREIFKNTQHPYTKGLFGALPDISVKTSRLHVIPGLPPDPTNLPQGCKFSPRCKYATDACKNGEVPLKKMEGTHACRCLCV